MRNNEFWVPGEKRFDPQFERKPSGGIIINGQEIAHTLQCVHCMRHYVSIRGSGKKRGFCMKCMGPLCGLEKCLKECEYFLEKLQERKQL